MILKSEEDIIAGLQKSRHIRTSWSRSLEPRRLNLTLDFTACTLGQVLTWAMKERVIAFQRTLRSMDNRDAFAAFHEAGPDLTIFALDADLNLSNHRTKEDLINALKGKV